MMHVGAKEASLDDVKNNRPWSSKAVAVVLFMCACHC